MLFNPVMAWGRGKEGDEGEEEEETEGDGQDVGCGRRAGERTIEIERAGSRGRGMIKRIDFDCESM